jgi:hypothetical protein
MESSEWVEGAQLSPLCAKYVVISVAKEPANISTNMRNTEHVHIHCTRDRVVHEGVFSVVVTKPMRGISPSRCVCTSCQHKGPPIHITLIVCQELGGSHRHHVTIEIVNIVLGLIDAWIRSIERYSVVIIALIVSKVSNERKEIS